MTSQVQSEANRRNALKSTGPKSKKGKGRARLNALKHGLRAKDIVLASEDGREFDGLRQALITELGPEGSLEKKSRTHRCLSLAAPKSLSDRGGDICLGKPSH